MDDKGLNNVGYKLTMTTMKCRIILGSHGRSIFNRYNKERVLGKGNME